MNLPTTQNDFTKILERLDSLAHLEAKVGGLEAEVVTLRERLASVSARTLKTHQNGNSIAAHPIRRAEELPAHLTDRRGMLKKVGAIAAGVAAVGLLRPNNGQAAVRQGFPGKEGVSPSATNDALLMGNSNSASGTAATSVFNPGTVVAPVTFRVDNYSTGSLGAPPAGNLTAGLFHINNASGTPTSGTFHALYAVAQSPAGGAGVGLHAEGDSRAINAVGPNGGEGVRAFCDGASTASWAVAGFSNGGQGGHFDGGDIGVAVFSNRAVLYLAPGFLGSPSASPLSFNRGEVISQDTGDLWYCAASGSGNSTAQFRKLSGPAAAGVAHILATPRRYVDTRNNTGGTGGPFSNGNVRAYDFDALQPGTIPAKARGVFGNITAVSPGGNGNFQANTANSFPTGSAAIMSFTPGVNLSNHFVSALDANGNMFVRANINSGLVHLIIDIQGYFI